MDVSYSEIIRETRNAINSRLDMLETLINRNNDQYIYQHYGNTSNTSSCDGHRLDYLNSKIETVNERVMELQVLVDKLNKANIDTNIRLIPLIPPTQSKEEPIPEIVVEEDAITQIKKAMNEDQEIKEVKNVKNQEEKKEKKENKEDVEEEEVEEEEVVVEEEEVVVEEEEEVVEDGLELEEFEYKGITLYRDSEMKVYRMNEDSSISDPIGIWDESKQKIKKL